ncbi:MAG: class I SAM-dependent methyltransferase [Flavobacteriales bacterium]
MEKADWFENWFNTKWYHILYGDRDYSEASKFIETIIGFLNPSKTSFLVDAACGSGRHSIHLNELGYRVKGFDLSPESIKTAKTFENERLSFEVADLRDFSLSIPADYIFNLFTSFGYFNSSEDNLFVLKCFNQSLSASGKILIDFFNSKYVKAQLVESEIKQIGGVDFHITRAVKEERIIKTIKFEAEGQAHEYEERVSAFNLDDFNSMLSASGFHITHTFGDYSLNKFDVMSSPRLLIIAEKN